MSDDARYNAREPHRLEALRDAAIAELPKVCFHRLPCGCRRRLIDKFIYVGLALADHGWTVKP